MDGSGGPYIGPVVFIILLLVDFILSGFGAALQTISESSVEQSDKGRDNKTEKLFR